MALLPGPAAVVLAQDGPDPFCAGLEPVHTPVVGSGWTYRVVAAGLQDPRGLAFDADGGLLVVEQRSGVRRLTFGGGGDGSGNGNDTCLALRQNTVVVRNENVRVPLFPRGTICFLFLPFFLPLLPLPPPRSMS